MWLTSKIINFIKHHWVYLITLVYGLILRVRSGRKRFLRLHLQPTTLERQGQKLLLNSLILNEWLFFCWSLIGSCSVVVVSIIKRRHLNEQVSQYANVKFHLILGNRSDWASKQAHKMPTWIPADNLNFWMDKWWIWWICIPQLNHKRLAGKVYSEGQYWLTVRTFKTKPYDYITAYISLHQQNMF